MHLGRGHISPSLCLRPWPKPTSFPTWIIVLDFSLLSLFLIFLLYELFSAWQPSWFLEKRSQIPLLSAQILWGLQVSLGESLYGFHTACFGPRVFLGPLTSCDQPRAHSTPPHWISWFCLKHTRCSRASDYLCFTFLLTGVLSLHMSPRLACWLCQAFSPAQSFPFRAVNPRSYCLYLPRGTYYVFFPLCMCLCVACISNIRFRKSQAFLFKLPKT